MLKFWVAIVASAQLLVLFYMAGQREFIRATGDVVYFRTAPLDPRDPLRGDYVRLNYDINSIRNPTIVGLNPLEDDEYYKEDEVFYVALNVTPNQLATLSYVAVEPPTDQLFIKGRVGYDWLLSSSSRLNLRYGIEQFFVEQGKGLEMEAKMGRRDGIQIPLEVEVALGGDGTAITRGYRWTDLGIQTEVLRIGRDSSPEQTNDPVSPRLRISIQNVSTAPLALVDDADHCGFSLISLGWTENGYPLVSNICSDYVPTQNDIISLAPEASHSFDFDLADPRWHVLIDDQAKEIGTLGFSEQFRFIYQSPSQEQIQALDSEIKIWPSDLAGRAFYATGRID